MLESKIEFNEVDAEFLKRLSDAYSQLPVSDAASVLATLIMTTFDKLVTSELLYGTDNLTPEDIKDRLIKMFTETLDVRMRLYRTVAAKEPIRDNGGN